MKKLLTIAGLAFALALAGRAHSQNFSTIHFGGDLSGTGTTWNQQYLGNSTVSNAKMANMAANSFKCNNTGGGTAPIDCTVAQALALITSTSGGGTTAFLNASGGFTVPAGTSTGSVTSVNASGGGIFSFTGGPVTVSGTLALAIAGTSGGIPYFSSASALSSSGVLTANELVLGGGAGGTPTVVSSLGTTTQLLHGNASGSPTWSAVSLTADVTNTLPVANGGSGAATLTGIVLGNGTSAFTAGNLSGDCTTSALVDTCQKINGTSFPVNSAADQAVITTASATGAWKSLPACTDSAGNHLNYDTATHTFSCGTSVPSNTKVRSFGTTFGDTGGSALTSGSIVYFTIPYTCTISAWNATVDAGTVTFDIWKIATGTAIPTVTNTITASALPAISTGTAKHSTTLTAWTTSVSANDIVGIKLQMVATAKYAELDVECDQ